MTTRGKILTLAVTLALAAGGGAAFAQGGKTMKDMPKMAEGATKAWHGGFMTKVGDEAFETVATFDGVCVYGYAKNGSPMRLDGATGTASVHLPDGSTHDVDLALKDEVPGQPTAYFCPMHPDATQMQPGVCKQCGGMKLMAQDLLFGDLSMKNVRGAVRADVTLQNVPGADGPVTFSSMIPMRGAMVAPPEGRPQPEKKAAPAPSLGNHSPTGK